MDTIGDFLTRVRNAIKARHQYVIVPASNLKYAISTILQEQGYIESVERVADSKQGELRITLKYQNGIPAIMGLRRISTPGLRRYSKATTTPRVLSGLGVAIISTPRGVMSDKQARQLNVGGEVLCYVW
ncbi:MAG TPA: 30S ribosomal protein S8 [Candidatus Kapabacteria bacterium]|nr:30S ribosomal protein S8 [Candidatus Kapabacteria bacterium]HYM36401.1 30S ribosomal protein S8 [Steroidobacteraceae bacterium]